ncbi:hypothetical protein C8Q79DRAFT_472887 [Trametes meyenii]|nr:hypothetical protein C8Q79DRAFT_472887 [Trametes meyenii]
MTRRRGRLGPDSRRCRYVDDGNRPAPTKTPDSVSHPSICTVTAPTTVVCFSRRTFITAPALRLCAGDRWGVVTRFQITSGRELVHSPRREPHSSARPRQPRFRRQGTCAARQRKPSFVCGGTRLGESKFEGRHRASGHLTLSLHAWLRRDCLHPLPPHPPRLSSLGAYTTRKSRVVGLPHFVCNRGSISLSPRVDLPLLGR